MPAGTDIDEETNPGRLRPLHGPAADLPIAMKIGEAQRNVRFTFLGGLAGQLVSGLLWLASAALATWGTPRQAIVTLVVGGFFIFPLTWLSLKLTGQDPSLRRDNPMNRLAMQVAFTLPLTLPLVGAATLYRLEWFYPSFMIVLGAHYLPFIFLYGMRMFAGLCGILVGGGLFLGLWGPNVFAAGGWITGVILMLAGLTGGYLVAREKRGAA
jgi:hypothetical protein